MTHQLIFERLVNYDPAQPGISLHVALKLNGLTVSCEAKIDTGSTFCIFSRKLGEDLGLSIESGFRRTVGTVTGTFIVYLHDINLSVDDLELSVLAGFAEDEMFQRHVLGRRGFLEQLVLGLVDYEGKLYLRAYDE